MGDLTGDDRRRTRTQTLGPGGAGTIESQVLCIDADGRIQTEGSALVAEDESGRLLGRFPLIDDLSPAVPWEIEAS